MGRLGQVRSTFVEERLAVLSGFRGSSILGLVWKEEIPTDCRESAKSISVTGEDRFLINRLSKRTFLVWDRIELDEVCKLDEANEANQEERDPASDLLTNLLSSFSSCKALREAVCPGRCGIHQARSDCSPYSSSLSWPHHWMFRHLEHHLRQLALVVVEVDTDPCRTGSHHSCYSLLAHRPYQGLLTGRRRGYLFPLINIRGRRKTTGTGFYSFRYRRRW